MPDRIALGLDIGGTNIKVGLVSERGGLIESAICSTPQRRDPADVVAASVNVTHTLLGKTGAQPEGMGIAFAGPIDLAGETVLAAPNFPGWSHVPLRKAIEDALGMPCVMGNDVDAFGLAEHCWGAAQGLNHFVAVAVGTGVGGAIFIGGKLYRGAWGGAAELGFTVISQNGPVVMGCPGALEGYVGRRGFDDIVLRLFPTGEVPTPRRITEMAESGDTRARQVHSEIAAHLAEAAASWLHILNPEAIVLGGGTLAGASFFIEEFETKLRARALKTHTENLKILPSKLGYYSGVQGAAAFWLTS